MKDRSGRPVIVFGISGATWTVIDPLLRAGRLPVLNELISRGSRGTLWSEPAKGDAHPRPQTAWTTIATGCLP
jgi:predicted AlkP superfamily phosphohydrolase/phosphomutase